MVFISCGENRFSAYSGLLENDQLRRGMGGGVVRKMVTGENDGIKDRTFSGQDII